MSFISVGGFSQGVLSKNVSAAKTSVCVRRAGEELVALLTKVRINMAKRLYVGGLPYSTTEDEIKEMFSQAGSVESATIIQDRMAGRSAGFGFVEMANDEEATKAIEMFDGKDFNGRSLRVNEARPMGERPPRREGGFGGGRGRDDRGGRREY